MEEHELREFLAEKSHTAWVYWSKKIAVELEEIRNCCKDNFAVEEIKNVSFRHAPVQDYLTKDNYDIVILAGLRIYLNEKNVSKMINNLPKMVHKDSIIYVKESTATLNKLELNDIYSEALSAQYSSVYRTRSNMINLFKKEGFKLVADGDMFKEGCSLDKYKEHRQRWYVFAK